ncbi:MAG: lysophospholipid acyltransferase family protein [Caulobacteraceae bacterium]
MNFKTFFRAPQVQGALAVVLSAYLDFALKTTRWTFENRATADEAVASTKGIIGCFWHGRIPLGPACREVLAHKPRKVIISLSPDGEFIARAMARLSFPAIRGSSARKDDSANAKGGAGATMESLRFLRSGGVVAITPDGPRGPAEEMAAGAVTLAKVSRVPVFLIGLHAAPRFRLRSWDKTLFPLPFGRGAVVFDGPLYAPRDADDAAMEALRLDWQARLTAANSRAATLVG